MLKKLKSDKLIYSDSITAISWVKKKKCQTKLKPNKNNKEVFILIERAIKWLKSNSYETQILKWETKKWGEIPVVFVSTNDKELTEKDVINITRGKIANYKLPKEVHFIDIEEFPRTETGKIQRHKLENYLTDLNKD